MFASILSADDTIFLVGIDSIVIGNTVIVIHFNGTICMFGFNNTLWT